jgi:hypothetical protein
LKTFFQANQFKTGYATHGLFPYRGKFHPQMVKALLNVMGLKPGETVLDPMMGSGTTLIEATLMGFNSIGVDRSPFCHFMTQAKLDGLRVPIGHVEWASQNAAAVFEHFSHVSGHPGKEKTSRKPTQVRLGLDRPSKPQKAPKHLREILEIDMVRNFLLLAFLDSAGYSIRSRRKEPFEQFRAILERYLFVARKIQTVLRGVESELGHTAALVGDARSLTLADSQVDGILFSPPYSFAIDYVKNDAFHLQVLGVDAPSLKEDMIGLRGGSLREQYDLYVQDIRRVVEECSRVLRPGRFCTIVVGTNNQQLSRILEVEPQSVKSIPRLLVELAEESGLSLVRSIERQITGIANIMRTEHVLFLQKR